MTLDAVTAEAVAGMMGELLAKPERAEAELVDAVGAMKRRARDNGALLDELVGGLAA